MPIVTVTMVQGRQPDELAHMMRSVSSAVADSLGTPIDAVRVIVDEVAEHRYAVGGIPFPDLQS